MLIGTAAPYDIPDTLEVNILFAANISSAGVGITAMRTATTLSQQELYHPYVLVYKMQILSTAVSGTRFMIPGYARTRSYLILVRSCVPGRL